MDLHALIHPAPPQDSPAAAAGLPGLRAQFPAMRLPLFPPPTVNDRADATSTRASPPLAPLRFIIPSSSSAAASASAPVPAPTSYEATAGAAAFREYHRDGGVPLAPSSFAADRAVTQALPVLRPASDEQEGEQAKPAARKPAGASKRSRPAKASAAAASTSTRSTKSKARPGLRKGKWTDEESRYAAQLTHYFKEGLLPIERGTMLRLYLSQKLNCEPMRITKKFTGGECIGKQVFRPCSPTPEARVRMMQAQLELVALEAAFIKRLKENRDEAPAAIQELEANAGAMSGSGAGQQRVRKRQTEDDELAEAQAGGEVDDANAVGLLLDFFYKANRKGDDKENDRQKQQQQQQQPTQAAPVEHHLSPVKVEIKREEFAEDDGERELPTANDDKDALVNSPTKRIRALSLSNFDPAAAKRSRVGSFTVCA